ncbi:Cerato-platanin [Madurella fahalii]|uniref:Cerato-platanin n=1 Tax=Madurella fahalii TaxID=1157608 RepID=A0ABQ0GJI3_9PEZI
MRRLFHFSFSLIAAATARAAGGTVWATPHESYSSSVGVLGCKVDTNRIAYWPASVDCNNICVSLSYEGRTVHLLRIDQSEGAYDVSYDAWNYLLTGYSATERPTTGGAVAMEYQDVDPSACASLIHTHDGKLPLSAANSMNFLASCLAGETWVGRNYAVYNILDPICSWGYDEVCTLDWPAANQAACPNTLGTPTALSTAPVYNIQYMTGNRILASSGQVVSSGGSPLTLSLSQNSSIHAAKGDAVMVMAMSLVTYWLFCRI